MNKPEPEVEIVDRVPSAKTEARRGNFSYKKFFRVLGKKPITDNRLFRFLLLLIITVALFDASWLTGYVIAASVYGWKAVDQTFRQLRNFIPKKLYLMFTLKKAFYFLLLVLVARFIIGLLIGWIILPILLLLNLYYASIDKK